MARMKTWAGVSLAAAAGVLLCACSSTSKSESDYSEPKVVAGNVKCADANACKGQTACKSASNACKGKNICKGQGWINITSKAECELKRGKVL
jgi:hypothetical protein